ncbi:MAG: hypothetical protein V2I33_06030, partial [Kangiellaceae bacterium]|nr:hypothetical protein [Kangiellaceae bacterium]
MSKYLAKVILELGVGDSEAKAVNQIAEAVQLADSPDSDGSIRRQIDNVLELLIKEFPYDLIKTGGGRGVKKTYFWNSADAKDEAFDRFKLKPKLKTFHHAMALNFIEEHFSELLPPDYVAALEDDFEAAKYLVLEDDEYRVESGEAQLKIVFEPSGYSIEPEIDYDSDDRRSIYRAL